MNYIQGDYSNAGSPSDLFRHEPLDLDSPSLRLVKLLSQSVDGQIECRMRLASIDEDYTCLSYVWGDPGSGKWISINNRSFFVRENLWNFLSCASANKNVRSRWLWIDAICIDQSNTIERQHQVQQMGEIYSGARGVISWLGINAHIAQFLGPSPYQGRNCFRAFINSPYWERAWITQEFVLARKVSLMTGVTLMPLDTLATIRHRKTDSPPTMFDNYRHGGAILPEVFGTRTAFRDMKMPLKATQRNTLVQLLEIYADKRCHIRRDSLFSLLGLCRNGPTFMVVYTIPDTEVAMDFFKVFPAWSCLCSLSLLKEILDLRSTGYPTVEKYISLDKTSKTFDAQTRAQIQLRIKEDHSRSFGDDILDDWNWRQPHSTMSSTDADVCSGGISVERRGYLPAGQKRSVVIIIDLSRICTMYLGTVTIKCDIGSIQYYIKGPRSLLIQNLKPEYRQFPDNESISLELMDEELYFMCSISMNFWL